MYKFSLVWVGIGYRYNRVEWGTVFFLILHDKDAIIIDESLSSQQI